MTISARQELATPRAKLRWFQYSLRSLLLLMLLVSIGMSWVAVKMQKARMQKEAVDAIRTLDGRIRYDYQLDASDRFLANAEPPGPAWLRRLIGDDFFTNVVEVDLEYLRITDADLERLKGLERLESLHLGLNVTDTGVLHLQELTQLRKLFLANTNVTDVGLDHLKGLTELETLDLYGTHVTDAGLEHLKSICQLQWLGLADTQVTDAGLEHLKGFVELRSLDVAYTQITDAGLEHLKWPKHLEKLNLWRTKITDAGLEHLKGLTQLQELYLIETKITDAGLEHLKGLTQLETLELRGTEVTDAGVEEIEQALPKCEVK